MPTSAMSVALHHLLADLGPDGDGRTDGELLARFVRSRDGDALAALVRRHAPMVWGVCRRLLRNPHDAEDAFQATFLVLVRKAAGVPRHAIANWLYSVARQTAVRVRATAAKRGRRETQVVNMPEPAMPELRDADPQSVVDEELSRLPDHYRGVVILCDLEGMTRKEAARQLGIPEGSVASRLARARALLEKRLKQRSIVFSGSVVAVLSAGSASMSAPPALVASTIKAASLLAAGQTAGVVSVKVAALTEGVVKAMFVSKLKAAFSVVLILGVLASGATFLTYRTAAGQEDKGKKAEAVAPRKEAEKPKVKDEDAIQGTWVVVKIEGVDKEAKDPKGAMKMVFKGDTVTVSVAGKSRGDAKFQLDPAKTPKRIQVSSERDGAKVTAPGIYKLDGDDLTICSAEDGATEPPDSFDIKNANLDIKYAKPGVSCWTLRREKEDKAEDKKPNAEKPKVTETKEPFTGWGKEVDGLQAGLGYKAGGQRPYHPGETVTLVIRVRNVGKAEAKLPYFSEFFYENPPAVTDGRKPIPLEGSGLNGFAKLKEVNLLPGKEIELCEMNLELKPLSESGKVRPVWRLFGTGRFQLHYDRVGGGRRIGGEQPDNLLSKLATGTLELEVEDVKQGGGKAQELQNERRATLKKLADQLDGDFKSGRGSVGEAYEARLEFLKAELEATEKGPNRIKLYEEAVDVAKAYEEAAGRLVKAGVGKEADVLKVKAKRLEAEIALDRAKGLPAAEKPTEGRKP